MDVAPGGGFGAQKMRDKGNYRAANGCSSTDAADPFSGFPRAAKQPQATDIAHTRLPGACVASPNRASSGGSIGYLMPWYPYHSIGMDSSGIQCYGIQWIAIHSMARQSTPWCAAATTARGKGQTNPGVPFHYNSGNAINHREVKACPAALPVEKNWSRPPGLPTPTT